MPTTYKEGDTVTIPYWDGPRERVLKATDYAVMLLDGEVSDIAYNWHTAESMILDSGHVAAVIRHPGVPYLAEQERMDAVRAAYCDCWGVEA